MNVHNEETHALRCSEKREQDSPEFIQEKRQKQLDSSSSCQSYECIFVGATAGAPEQDLENSSPSCGFLDRSAQKFRSPVSPSLTLSSLPPLHPLDSPSHKKVVTKDRGKTTISLATAPTTTLERFDTLDIAWEGRTTSRPSSKPFATATACYNTVIKKQSSSPCGSSPGSGSMSSSNTRRGSSSILRRQASLTRSESFRTESSSRTSCVSRADSSSSAAEFEFYLSRAKRSPDNFNNSQNLLPDTQLLRITSQSDGWPHTCVSNQRHHGRPDDPVACALLDDDTTVESSEPKCIFMAYNAVSPTIGSKSDLAVNQKPRFVATSKRAYPTGSVSNGGGCWTKIAHAPQPSRQQLHQSHHHPPKKVDWKTEYSMAATVATTPTRNSPISDFIMHPTSTPTNPSSSTSVLDGSVGDSFKSYYKRVNPVVLLHKADSERSMICLPEIYHTKIEETSATLQSSTALTTPTTDKTTIRTLATPETVCLAEVQNSSAGHVQSSLHNNHYQPPLWTLSQAEMITEPSTTTIMMTSSLSQRSSFAPFLRSPSFGDHENHHE